MLEKTVKAAVRKRLKQLGAYQCWPVLFGMGERTVDCIGCYKGRFFAIECKAPGKQPTDIQLWKLSKIAAAGGAIFVIDTVEKANELTANSFEI